MQLRSRLCSLGFFTIFAIFLTSCTGLRSDTATNAGSGSTSATLQSSVGHIVIMMQENRSFDHYFGQLNAYRTSKGLPADVDDLSRAGTVALPGWQGDNN